MKRYIARRLLAVIPVWIGISILAFGLGNLAPGDPAMVQLQRIGGARSPTGEELARVRHEMGLDDPLPVRYAAWAFAAAHGDLGRSYANGQPVATELIDHFPATLQLALSATVLAVVVAVPLGILAATRRDSIADHLSRLLALAGASLPGFWMAYLLILVFAVQLHLLPVSGMGRPQNLVLPTVTLAIAAVAVLTRLTRSSMLEVLGTDYVRTAHAKGLNSWRVIFSHAFRNAQIPLVTLFGLQFAGLLEGAVVAETIFAWPGIGKLLIDAIGGRDYPVIQGFVVFTGTLFVLVNLAVDIAYVWLDPRIKLAAPGH